jgi:hypothetical protein
MSKETITIIIERNGVRRGLIVDDAEQYEAAEFGKIVQTAIVGERAKAGQIGPGILPVPVEFEGDQPMTVREVLAR